MDLGGWRWTGTRRSREQENSSGSGEQGSGFLSREQGNSSGSGSWIWKPGDIHPDVPVSTQPLLGFGIHFPDGMTRKIEDLDAFNHAAEMPIKEFSNKYFDSPDVYERKLREAMERKEADERNWRLYREPITCEVCLESAYHIPEQCPYLEHVEQPWNATVGEGYKIVCYCCQKPRSEVDHPDGRWSGYASKILPTYTMIWRED